MVDEVYIMIKPVSGKCDLHCQYCFYLDEMKKREKADYGIMSEDTLEIVIKKTLSFAKKECTIAYQGGEPTLAGLDFYKKSIFFQEKYNVNRVVIHNVLQTNGYSLNDEWSSFFKENHFLLGVSLDGLKAIHDKYRVTGGGEGTYLQVLNNIESLQKYGVDFNILTVVNRATAPKIGRIYEYYKKKGFWYQQYIACIEPMAEAAGRKEYSLSPQQYGEFLISLFGLWKNDWEKGCSPIIRQFENWIGILKGIPPEACEQRGVCGIQNVVEADGTVFPCDFYALEACRLGNLKNDSMDMIYQNREESLFISKSRNHDEKCLECPYILVCRGGCKRYRETGINIYCGAYKMFFDRYLEDLINLARIL